MKSVIVVILVSISIYCKAQSLSPDTLQLSGKYRKSIFSETLGNSLVLISGNFDMRLKPDRNDGLGLRVGVGIASQYLTLPLAINYIVGKRKSGFESGIGITPVYNSDPANGDPKFMLDELLTIGYRFQPMNSGFMLRATWSANYYRDDYSRKRTLGFILPGLSVGYSFK